VGGGEGGEWKGLPIGCMTEGTAKVRRENNAGNRVSVRKKT